MNKTLFVLLFAAVSNAAVLGADSGAPPAGDGKFLIISIHKSKLKIPD